MRQEGREKPVVVRRRTGGVPDGRGRLQSLERGQRGAKEVTNSCGRSRETQAGNGRN